MLRTIFIASIFLLSPICFAEKIADHVVIVSIDGGKPSTIEKTDLPNLKALAKAGSVSWNAQTILPSATLMSHASMISGVDMDVHGVNWNDYIPSKGLIRVETIFSHAKKSNLKTAMIAGKEKFKHLNLPSSIDSFQLNYGGDQSVANAFEKLFLNEKPNLTLVHLPKVDWTGHRYGWDTTKYIQALKTADKAVGTIVSAIKNSGLSEKTLLIITADHGGTGRGHGGAIPAHRNIPWLAWGVGVKPNNSLPAGISTMDTAATALWALDISVPSEMEGSPVLQAFN